MKTLNCSGNDSVSWRKGAWRITVKLDDNSRDTLKSGSNIQNVVRSLRVYAPNPSDRHSNVWDLIDPFERHANSYKRIETTGM